MEITQTEKISGFFAAYAANFGKLTERDGMDYFESWISRPATDIDAATRAVDRIGQNWDGKFRPKLGQVKRAMQDGKYEDRQERTTTEKYVVPDCNLCSNTGKVWVVVGVIDGQRFFVNDGNRGKATEMKPREHPCKCPRGIAQNHILFNHPESFDDYTKIAKLLKVGWKKHFINQQLARHYTKREAINGN